MDRQRRNVCHHFARTGRCRFGAQCKYSHDLAGAPPVPARRDPPPRDDVLHQWLRLLRPSSGFSANRRVDEGTLPMFFQLGLKLMDGDIGASQDATKKLASEDGLKTIGDLLDRIIIDDYQVTTALWTTCVKPLFQLVTHARIVDSAVLEQEVFAIYNFMSGVNGRRAARTFNFVAELLENHIFSADDKAGVLELTLCVLSKIVDCNSSNIVNESFGVLSERFTSLIPGDEAENEFAKLQATKYLQYIQKRLGCVDTFPNSSTPNAPTAPVTRAEFVLRRDMPGTLSPEGPRHDNDHSNICNINIMPTEEEIMSPRNEYLPTTDPTEFHIGGIRGRLDREFRLLREDTVGQLRDTVRVVLDNIEKASITGQRGATGKNLARTSKYDRASIHQIDLSAHRGAEITVRFKQPITEPSAAKRDEFWQWTKRMQPGALVCVLPTDLKTAVGARVSLLFCTVADSTQRVARGGRTTEAENKGKDKDAAQVTLSGDAKFAYVKLQLVEDGTKGVKEVLRWFRDRNGEPQERMMVEFPGVMVPSFYHTLKALQQMYENPQRVPFADLIAQEKPSGEEQLQIPVPIYATRPGFGFELKCVTSGSTSLRYRPGDPFEMDRLSSRSSLDETQSAALLNTLTRGLSLIQGPPGTGKSYTGEKLIQVLLGSNTKDRIGPILCVCYTNHALDQLLEHLLHLGIDNIIRIGSRSKSEQLEKVNLREVVKQMDRTRGEKSSMWELDEQLRGDVEALGKLVGSLGNVSRFATVKHFLETKHPASHNELFGDKFDSEGFKVVRPDDKQVLSHWLRGGERNAAGLELRSIEQLQTLPLDRLTHLERRHLHSYWLQQIRKPIVEEIVDLYENRVKIRERRDKIRREVDLRCLNQAKVIGVTTTGLARNLALLQKLRSKVMLCEEAGEVLESHTLTALLPSVEHAILIGDHQQLRPQIQNYELQSTNPRGEQYSLDVSLFERLVDPKHPGDARLPLSVLETQRRMHPSISNLIRGTLYPKLKDSENVAHYPEVVGFRKRLFWLHHENLEAGASQEDPLSTSHSNQFEIDMLTVLVTHLVRQGVYGPEDIAVVTPYLGQLFKIRKNLSNMFAITLNDRDVADLEELDEDMAGQGGSASPANHSTAANVQRQLVQKTTLLKSIRIATVDNFQGEEAKVVIISLVRSNPQNKCGFLSTPNRINVLLSRAQHGMYIVGNANTYGHVPMWANVIQELKREDNFGTSLELQCPRHPDDPISVSRPDHFLQFAPDGGCIRPCDKRLQCGHSCRGPCHADSLHNAFWCLEPCARLKPGCTHACRRPCGDKCEPKCTEPLNDLGMLLKCGHIHGTAPCWQAQDPDSIVCRVQVNRTVSGCRHQVTATCATDITSPTFQCKATCGTILSCGHNCRSRCSQCNVRVNGEVAQENHSICKQVCGRNYTTCPHSCQQACHDGTPCSPCQQPCEVRCSHSKCAKRCHEPCSPCAVETCTSSCEHSKCSMPCAAPCDWVPCSRRCAKLLKCGHQCPSICGEACPDPRFCQICATEDVKDTVVDFTMFALYKDQDLDQDPCIFPDCGHFLSMSSMDGVMDLKQHFVMNEDDVPVPTAVTTASTPFSMSDVQRCPTCRGSLRNIGRYGRIVRRGMLDEATKKFITWSMGELSQVTARFVAEQARLEATPKTIARARDTLPAQEGVLTSYPRPKLLRSMNNWAGNDRYQPSIKLWNMIKKVIGQVMRGEQPLQRVADLVTHARRQQAKHLTAPSHLLEKENSNGMPNFHIDESEIQYGSFLKSVALQLKCDVMIVADFLQLVRHNATLAADFGQRPDVKLDFKAHRKDCLAFVDLATSKDMPKLMVDGHICFATFCAFGLNNETSGATEEVAAIQNAALKEEGLVHITTARKILEMHPSLPSEILTAEIDAAERRLTADEPFYEPLTPEELRAVAAAMAAEFGPWFSGTGHWYTCANGHPFTVGECGRPMAETRCPECGAAVGGQHHRAAEGVQRAREIDELVEGVQRL